MIKALLREKLDQCIQDAINVDGRGHFLSSYDGQEFEYSIKIDEKPQFDKAYRTFNNYYKNAYQNNYTSKCNDRIACCPQGEYILDNIYGIEILIKGEKYIYQANRATLYMGRLFRWA